MSSPNTTEILDEVILDGVPVPMASGGITEETDPTVPQYVKNITEQDIENWNNKADVSQIPTFTVSGTTLTITTNS